MLYTFISAGNERVGAMPDPPSDFTRVRCVCALLDACGHYFDRGTTKKKLDVFLGHFQRYLFGKDVMPMDIDFAVSDVLEVIAPKFQRVDTVEAADEYVAKLEGEHKFSKVRGLHALEVVKDRADGDDSEEEDDDNRNKRDAGEGSDDEGDGDAGRKGKEDGEGGEEMDAEEERDAFDYHDEHVEDDDDEAVVVHWKPQAAQPSPEDDLFEAEFAKMLLDNRATTGPRRTQLEVAIPLELQAESAAQMPDLVERAGETKVVFKLLTKKNNKATTRELEVPIETTIAHASFDRSNAEAHEKDEVKRKVLGMVAAEDCIVVSGLVCCAVH